MPDNLSDLTEKLYRSLYRIRRVEEEVERIYPTDKIKSPIHLSIGQESIAVGVRHPEQLANHQDRQRQCQFRMQVGWRSVFGQAVEQLGGQRFDPGNQCP